MDTTRPTIAPTPENAAPVARGRIQRVSWRIGFLLTLAVLGFLWIRSWSQIDHRLISTAIGAIEMCLAGSSAAISYETGGFPYTVDFVESLGPPDSEQLLTYDAHWIDGDSFGRVSNSCLFPPGIDSLERIDLNRTGSFGAMLTERPSPAGRVTFIHLRIPLWFLMVLVIGGWIWMERSTASRRRRAVPG